jgi:hypothetical protein
MNTMRNPDACRGDNTRGDRRAHDTFSFFCFTRRAATFTCFIFLSSPFDAEIKTHLSRPATGGILRTLPCLRRRPAPQAGKRLNWIPTRIARTNETSTTRLGQVAFFGSAPRLQTVQSRKSASGAHDRGNATDTSGATRSTKRVCTKHNVPSCGIPT